MENIGILDPKGLNINPLNNRPYSEKYKELGKFWSNIPTYERIWDVLSALESNQLIFIVSSTGSGKTVLIPKIALHYFGYNGRVGVTLPKRIITLSTAEFSAETLDVRLGVEVGYLYKGSPKEAYNKETNKLVYMTDGIFVAKYVADPTLSEFNCIVIDEAHERKVQIDLILLFLKKLLKSGLRPDLKVIIMSATIDFEHYQNYFSGIKSTMIEIAGMTMHPIEVRFPLNPVKSYMTEGYELIQNLISDGIRDDMLFFITASSEAFNLCKKFNQSNRKIYCIEVYRDMESDMKKYATSKDKYKELGDYDQKLVMATNVAESSLTIKGLKYVIDSGYELYSYFDPNVGGQVLEKNKITRAQAMQRRGRVGRTEPGICYHLMTIEEFENLEPYPKPDIQKQDITMDLINIILTTPNRTLSEGLQYLAELMDPPLPAYINYSKKLFDMYEIIINDKLSQTGLDISRFRSQSFNASVFLLEAYLTYCAREASWIVATIDETKGDLSLLLRLRPCDSATVCNDSINQTEKNRPDLQQLGALISKKSDHLTILNIMSKFNSLRDDKKAQMKFVNKHNLRTDLLDKILGIANRLYRSLITIKTNKMSGGKTAETSINTRILSALKLSHQHLMTKGPEFKISKNSIINLNYKKSDLANKTIIYNQLSKINGVWTYEIVTIQ